MQTFIGRLVNNATVNTVKEENTVVNFSIAVNDRYKLRNGEVKETTTFIKCAYWRRTGIAAHLTKGMLVELHGHIGINVWNNTDGKATGTLVLHVNNIKMHGKAKQPANNDASQPETETAPVTEDLPF